MPACSRDMARLELMAKLSLEIRSMTTLAHPLSLPGKRPSVTIIIPSETDLWKQFA
jgi:hypothetical protein